MTAPMEDNATDPKTGVSLLGRIFGKVQRAPQPPAGLEDHVSFTDRPGSNGSDAAYWFPGRQPEMDDGYFPTVPQQDALLVHWDRPPGDENPQAWYDDRNVWAKYQRENIEKQTGVQQQQTDTGKSVRMADNPNWTPPDVKRPTAFENPNGYSFTRPFDQTSEHELNGVHLSLADNKRAYVLGGSVGRINGWNNSYRIDPVTNDATAVFVGDSVMTDQSTVVMYSPDMAPAARSWRL